MAYYYPLENITDPLGFLLYTNKLTNYMMGPAIIGAFFVIMFVSMKRYESEKAFAASSFLSAILCFLFFLIGLTSVEHVMLAGIAVIVSVFALRFSSGGV